MAVPLLAAAAWALAARPPAGPVAAAPLHSARPASGTALRGKAPDPQHADPVEPQTDSVLLDATLPAARPIALLQELSDRRGRALVERDTRALATAHAEGSPSNQADQQLIGSLRASGTRWEGLRADVGEASFRSGNGRTATVRARVDWTAYVVVDARGRRAHAAERGDLLDFRLERGPAGWRIVSISAAPAS